MVKWVAGHAVSGSRHPPHYARAEIPSKSSEKESEQKTERPLTEYSTHLWLIHTERHSHSKNLTSPDSAHTAANVTASNIHISLSAERMEDLDESEQEKERNFQRAALKSLSGTTSELIERPCVSGNNSERVQKNFVEQLLLTGEQHYNMPPSWCMMGYEEKCLTEGERRRNWNPVHLLTTIWLEHISHFCSNNAKERPLWGTCCGRTVIGNTNNAKSLNDWKWDTWRRSSGDAPVNVLEWWMTTFRRGEFTLGVLNQFYENLSK